MSWKENFCFFQNNCKTETIISFTWFLNAMRDEKKYRMHKILILKAQNLLCMPRYMHKIVPFCKSSFIRW